MSTIPKNDELIFKEYESRCHTLRNDNMRMRLVKQNLLFLNEKNENISKSLLSIKTECELYKSHLHRTLYNQKVATEKQKILSRKKLDEFLEIRKKTEEYYKMSPICIELEELVQKNARLEEEWKKTDSLFKLTKEQYNELLNLLIETFKKKVCEFCQAVSEYDLTELEVMS